MYNDGQVLGASTTAGVAVTTLPLTSGNMIFQSILIATLVVALIVLAVRIIKIAAAKHAK